MINQSHDRAALHLFSALRHLPDRHVDMTLQQAMAFLYVAAHPGCTQREIFRALDTSDSAASRNLALLSEFGNRNTPGLELVVMRVNPLDRRERRVELTSKGKRLFADMLRELAPVPA